MSNLHYGTSSRILAVIMYSFFPSLDKLPIICLAKIKND